MYTTMYLTYTAYIGQYEGISRKQLVGYSPKGTHIFPLKQVDETMVKPIIFKALKLIIFEIQQRGDIHRSKPCLLLVLQQFGIRFPLFRS